MEAKDTVMTAKEIGQIPINENGEPLGATKTITIEDRLIAQAQAEATWDIAFKAGIREVVKWCDKLCILPPPPPQTGTLEINGIPRLPVSKNGVFIGRTPLTIKLQPGIRDISLGDVPIRAGETTRITIL